MRKYVTGANGFIGKHLVDTLDQKQGHDVMLVKRPISVLNNHKEDQPFEFFHLSAYGNHYDQKDIDQLIQSNIADLSTVLKFVKNDNCVKFYNISTSSIQLPKQTIYSTSKLLGELMVESYGDSRFVNVRPYNVYGPGEAAHRFIPTVIRALESGETIQLDEHATHDWILVDDFINAMFEGHTRIGTGKCFTNLDIVWMLEDISKRKLKYEPAKLRIYDTNNWVCAKGVDHIPIYEGLKLTYESFTQKNIRDKQEA